MSDTSDEQAGRGHSETDVYEISDTSDEQTGLGHPGCAGPGPQTHLARIVHEINKSVD